MRLFLTALCLFLFMACKQKKAPIELPALTHPKQIELNEQYADKENSPLTDEDFKKFKSLPFFPEDDAFKVEAQFELTPDAPVFEMPTSTDRLPKYRKYLEMRFVVNGVEEELSAYQNLAYMTHPEYGKYLFIPFLDETNGIDTYGGGRYIDIEIPAEGDSVLSLDFNACYNPLCAYNHQYSCPKPPLENALDIEVKAGVKYGLIYK